MSGLVTQNVTIPDIEHGSWSMVGQPHSPSFKENDLSFLD